MNLALIIIAMVILAGVVGYAVYNSAFEKQPAPSPDANNELSIQFSSGISGIEINTTGVKNG